MRARLAAAVSVAGAAVLLWGVPAGAGDDPGGALPDSFQLDLDTDPDPDSAIPFPDLTTPPENTLDSPIPFPDLTTPPDNTLPDGFQLDLDTDPTPDSPIPFPEIGEPAGEVAGDQTDEALPPIAPLPADWAPADLQPGAPAADPAPTDQGPGIPFPELHTPAPAPADPPPPPLPDREPAGPITIGTVAASLSDAIDAIELPLTLLAGAAVWVVLLALVLAAFNSRQAMHSITGVKEGAFVPAYHRPGGGDAKTMAFAFRHSSVKLWQAGPGRRKGKRRWLPLQSPVGRVWVDRSLTRPAHRVAAPVARASREPDDPDPDEPGAAGAAEELPLGTG